jgi:hypothetical protein
MRPRIFPGVPASINVYLHPAQKQKLTAAAARSLGKSPSAFVRDIIDQLEPSSA